MKKTLCILLAMMLLLSLTACGADLRTEGPTEDMLHADLQQSLSDYRIENDRYPIEIKECQIVKSLTKDKTYTAEVNVIAESVYAEYEYGANVVYTLYDQGWDMDSCDWSSYGYEAVRYPSEDELEGLENSDVIKTISSPILNGNGNYFQVSGNQNVDWSQYVSINSECAMLWYYNERYDSWAYYRTENNQTEYVLNAAFEKAWRESINLAKAADGIFSVDGIQVELESSNLHEDEISLVFESSGDNEVDLRIIVNIYREPKSIDGKRYDMVITIGKTRGNTTNVSYDYHYLGE